jgi:hypothetical protein
VILSNVKAIKNIGVGNGKNDASAKAQINNAQAPHLVFAHSIPQLCSDLSQFFIPVFDKIYGTIMHVS